MLEAVHLQDDPRRAGIEPWGWIIVASLASEQTTNPLLRRTTAAKAPQITEVRDALASRYAVVPMQAVDPVGRKRLIALCRGATRAEL